MELDSKSTRMLNSFTAQMVSISKSGKIWLAVSLVFILGGLYGLIVQIVDGHIVTGMRDNVVWGIYIANFIFFIGISYAGALISGILHLLRVPWRTPIIRIAEIITVISTLIGPAYILLCMGRLDRLHHLALFGRIQSPIIWDVLAISTYLIGSIIFLYLASIRDLAVLRDYPFKSKWRHKIYKFLAFGFNGNSKQNRYLDRSLDIMSAIIIPLAVLVHSVLAWIFGMTLRPGWHSTIFAPYFVVAAVFSGTGVLIIALWVFRKYYNLQSYITKIHFNYLGIILMVLGALYAYFTFSEYLTSWYGSETWEMEVLYKLFDPNEYWWWFVFAAILGVLLPIIVIVIPKFRTINSITFVSLIAVLALWVKRYLIIIPTLETPLLPLQDMRPEYIHYQATMVEWLLTFSGVALFCLLFFLFSKFIPILPVVKAEEGKNYAELRKSVMKRIMKRKIEETKKIESEKIKYL
jgi:Ni/Fe-hydrogenase subunit HybB-like protein